MSATGGPRVKASGRTPRGARWRQGWIALRERTLHSMDAVPLSTKLVACMLILLLAGTLGITLTIRQLVSGYLLEKTDTQLKRQASLVFNNIRLLSQEDNSKNGVGPTNYYLQIRDQNLQVMPSSLTPRLPDGVVSMPRLPAPGSMGHVIIGEAFTTPAVVEHMQSGTAPDYETVRMAHAPWRVVAMEWEIKGGDLPSISNGVLFIGLSLSDMQDTISTLTRYCLVVGAGIVVLGAVLAALLIQRTLRPLKRIEKTAAKIAAGDLSQRIPAAPENTEVGSLSFSLNTMLARIERSFHEQEETTEKMKRFVSDASHELRTPLAAVHGYAELYRMQRDYPGALERADSSINHIEAASTRMAALVEDLLSLARLDEGRGIDLNQQVDLTALVTDSADDLHALDPGRAVERGTADLQLGEAQQGERRRPYLRFRPGPWMQIRLQGDPSRLRQVMTNVVGNIHRYTPSDSPVQIVLTTLSASIAPKTLAALPSDDRSLGQFLEAVQVAQSAHAGTEYAVMLFIDHGPGVAAEQRAKLFERFYTADPSRAREKGGTGLGLAIAQSVVRAHRGLICATGTPGGGLTFSVVVPITDAKPAVNGQADGRAVE